MSDARIRVAVTGAAGQIGYALLFRIASGQMFGAETEIDLNLLELEGALPALRGVVMELEDCAFPLLKSVTQTADANVAFKDVDWSLLVGSVPRKQGMERGDLLKINGAVFTRQGRAISDFAKDTSKVLVVGNPCNTNAYIAKEVAKNIPSSNFYALTMLDQNRAFAQLAQKSGEDVRKIKNVTIWGNHSATQYPDFYNGSIDGIPVLNKINDENWLQTEFIESVQKRGAAIIKARGLSSAASAANAIVHCVSNIITPTAEGEHFSLGICSKGSYGIDEGLIFSYPCRSNGKEIDVVQDIEHNVFAKEKLKITHNELQSEREEVKELIAKALTA